MPVCVRSSVSAPTAPTTVLVTFPFCLLLNLAATPPFGEMQINVGGATLKLLCISSNGANLISLRRRCWKIVYVSHFLGIYVFI